MFILLQHDSVGPHGGFSFFVFKELVNRGDYSKLLRLGEEFQEELASFLKEWSDLLWLHEICLNQFSSASETLHTYALRGSPDGDASFTTSRKPLSFVERRRLLYLSKIAATAGRCFCVLLWYTLHWNNSSGTSHILHTFMALHKIEFPYIMKMLFYQLQNLNKEFVRLSWLLVISHA